MILRFFFVDNFYEKRLIFINFGTYFEKNSDTNDNIFLKQPWSYDGSFDGHIEVFEYHYQNVEIIQNERFHQENIFAEIHKVITQTDTSERVFKQIRTKYRQAGSPSIIKSLFIWRSCELENLIVSAVEKSVKHTVENILKNSADPDILKIELV